METKMDYDTLLKKFLYYHDLDMKGLVFHKSNDDLFCVMEFLLELEPDIKLDIEFKYTTQGTQFRTKDKLNIQKHLLNLSKYVAVKYRKDFNKAPLKMKLPITIQGIVEGKPSLRNYYPPECKKYVKDWLLLHPVKDWKNEYKKS